MCYSCSDDTNTNGVDKDKIYRDDANTTGVDKDKIYKDDANTTGVDKDKIYFGDANTSLVLIKIRFTLVTLTHLWC